MPKTVQVEKIRQTIPEWNFACTYIETCNCDYGCPCNFDGFPTYGFCRGFTFYHIIKGSYGDVKLGGLDVVGVGIWPKAIHEGDGTLQYFISEKANEDQRKALGSIFYGRAKGNGAFAIFASTCKYLLDPQYVKINYKLNGKNSSYSVPGVLEVKLESFKNPVTGAEQETEIRLPKGGIIWSVARACKTKLMRIVSPNFGFDDSGKNAFYCEKLEYEGP